MSNSNRYPGACRNCGQQVAAQAGLLVKIDGKFLVEHRECPTAPKARFAPTAEQQACIALFGTGVDMLIDACAGAGKTSTLRLLAESDPTKRFLYVAYNKAIVTDVTATMPKNVKAATAHSLAWQAGGKRFAARLKLGRQRRYDIARHLGIDTPLVFKQADGAPPKRLSPEQLAGVVMQAVGGFCRSADERPARKHFPYVDKIDPAVDGKRVFENNDLLRGELLPAVERAWADICNPDGWLKHTHDFYLKMFQLEHPRLPYDVVLLDEAQDANPVIAAIVEEQQGNAQLVLVGDENQQIYEWNGAVDAMKKFAIEGRARLSQSFRFGPAIADLANETLAQLARPTEMRVRGHEPIGSTVGEYDGDVDAILCRTNARAIEELMTALESGQKPFLVGGGTEIAAFARAALDLQGRGVTEHPELSCFDSWTQVVEFVAQDPQGEELRQMVKLIEAFTARTILAALDGMGAEADARPIISTAHKAKGREWDRVRLASDFIPPMERPLEDADIRLRYVAVTRAKLHLDHSALLSPAPETKGDGPTGPSPATSEEAIQVAKATCDECDGEVTPVPERTNSDTGEVRSARWVHVKGPHGWAFDQADGTIGHEQEATA